jgi:hypothetical protein
LVRNAREARVHHLLSTNEGVTLMMEGDGRSVLRGMSEPWMAATERPIDSNKKDGSSESEPAFTHARRDPKLHPTTTPQYRPPNFEWSQLT